MPNRHVASELEQLHRNDYGRILASLIGSIGDLAVAEDAIQEAFATALSAWETEIPVNPAGWLYRVAHNKAIDRLRRAETLTRKAQELASEASIEPPAPAGEELPLVDERLKLVFTCCHPALSTAARVALTLKAVGGLTTPEIASAFLVKETTMAQRIVRAKRKISAAGIPFRVPPDGQLPDRLSSVLSVVYLIYTEGHSASSTADTPFRVDLCDEGVRLSRELSSLMPDEPEASGLLALLLFADSRRSARVDSDRCTIRLSDQNRELWDSEAIAEADEILVTALRRVSVGPYQLQAAIAGVHSSAASWEETDWHQVLALYDELVASNPSPVVSLNRAVALSYAHSPSAAIGAIEALKEPLSQYQPWHAAQADMFSRLGRRDEAVDAYAMAIAMTENLSDRALLERLSNKVAARK